MLKNLILMCVFLTVILIANLHSAFAQRIGAPHASWNTLETPHFSIFYSAEHQDLGLYYATIAENSYAALATVFTDRPTDKIVVIINDSTDVSNGFATMIPYPHIMVYPVQIGKGETLSEAGEWGQELFIHELTHIFQMYPANSFYKFLKPIFGNIVAPNMLMPSWWKEGMAVEIETHFSHQGRNRSYYQDAALRALVLDKKLFKYSLAEINEALPNWPYGGRPYLFGSILMGHMAATKNIDVFNDLTIRQSEKVPFAIEDAHLQAFGIRYEQNYLNALQNYENIAEEQIAKIQTSSATQIRLIDSKLASSENPRWSSLKNILGLISFDKSGRKLNFYKKNESQNWEKVKFPKQPSGEVSSFEFHPTENKILYAKVKQINLRESFSDLYFYDFITEKNDQLTFSARARGPIFGLNPNHIFYISTFSGKTQINRLDIQTKYITKLLETPFNQRIIEIQNYSADELLVVIKTEKGESQVFSFSIESRSLVPFKMVHQNIENIKNINQTLYFTATDNGVNNIYQMRDNNVTAITNFETGGYDFDVSADSSTVYAAVMTSNGMQVHEFQTTDVKKLPVIKNPIRDRYKDIKYDRPEDFSCQNICETNEASVLKYIYPQYFIPFISTSSRDQNLYFQIITSGQDPLMKHRYDLSIDYDTAIKKAGYNLNYLNSTQSWPINLTSAKTFKLFGQSQLIYENDQHSLGFIPDTVSLSPNLILNVGILYSSIKDTVLKTEHSGLYAQMLYSSFEKNILQIYPMSGFSFFVRHESNKASDKQTSSLFSDYDQTLGSLNYYFSKWLPEDHSIANKINFIHTYQKVSNRYGASNAAFSSSSDTYVPEFTLRGYAQGQFFGTRMVTINTEYRFPIETLNKGSGTDPYFLKRLNGAVIFDALTHRGLSIDKNSNVVSHDMSEIFSTAGLEVRLETTIGYFLPVNFIVGGYYPFADRYADSSPQIALSLQIGGL